MTKKLLVVPVRGRFDFAKQLSQGFKPWPKYENGAN